LESVLDIAFLKLETRVMREPVLAVIRARLPGGSVSPTPG